ncbi:cysteine-rich and transmembrane domain-containing protein WIH2 [Sesbania bispinosa]|nr:cysteine-rich and transmembrane domain-containing protein WIH2 [Sesbania bispinosa]
MSYYNQQQPPVGVPPLQGYPYPYAPQYTQPPHIIILNNTPYPHAPQYAEPPPPDCFCVCLEGCLAALCCFPLLLLGACF